jgi:hypothetical protein
MRVVVATALMGVMMKRWLNCRLMAVVAWVIGLIGVVMVEDD